MICFTILTYIYEQLLRLPWKIYSIFVIEEK